MPTPTIKPSSFIILSDSHGKHLQPIIPTSNYHIITQSIPGLRWMNQYDDNLCTRSLILSSSISSLLSSCTGVLFLIGTNSVRTTSALEIMEQIEDIINIIRSFHVHLKHKSDITIVATFPCYKTSSRFPTTDLLTYNISCYNEQLQLLSDRMNFSYLDLHINNEHLHYGLMHLKFQHQNFLRDSIINYFDALFVKNSTISQSKHRSRTAIIRRNKKRHEKLKMKQKQFVLIRSIHPSWKLPDLKQLLKYHQIKHARLPEIYKHKLRIQFNNEVNQQHAEQILPSTTFDANSYMEWCQQHQ